MKALGFKTGIQAYIRAIPYCFYPILTIAIVFLFALGVMPKLGAMKKAYKTCGGDWQGLQRCQQKI